MHILSWIIKLQPKARVWMNTWVRSKLRFHDHASFKWFVGLSVLNQLNLGHLWMSVELVPTVWLLYKFYLSGLDKRKYEFQLVYTIIVILDIISGYKMLDDHFTLIYGYLDDVYIGIT